MEQDRGRLSSVVGAVGVTWVSAGWFSYAELLFVYVDFGGSWCFGKHVRCILFGDNVVDCNILALNMIYKIMFGYIDQFSSFRWSGTFRKGS